MARIDFDDSVYKGDGYANLLLKVGCLYKAKGLLITAWELAQLYWLEYKAIPYDKWPEALNVLIEAKFARLEQVGGIPCVYVLGSKERCSFLEARSEAGKKGGKKSATRHRNENGQFVKTSNQEPSNTKQVSGKRPNKTKQNQASVSVSFSDSVSVPYSGSGSDSDLISAEIEISPQAGGFDPKKKTSYFLAQYADRFKQRHGANPEIAGKDAGIAARLIKSWGQDKIDLYLEAYFAMPDAWVVKAKHPIALLESKINEVAVFANTGNFTTRTQVNQADSIASNMILLEKVRKNSV